MNFNKIEKHEREIIQALTNVKVSDSFIFVWDRFRFSRITFTEEVKCLVQDFISVQVFRTRLFSK